MTTYVGSARDGYLVVPSVVSENLLAAADDEIDSLIREVSPHRGRPTVPGQKRVVPAACDRLPAMRRRAPTVAAGSRQSPERAWLRPNDAGPQRSTTSRWRSTVPHRGPTVPGGPHIDGHGPRAGPAGVVHAAGRRAAHRPARECAVRESCGSGRARTSSIDAVVPRPRLQGAAARRAATPRSSTRPLAAGRPTMPDHRPAAATWWWPTSCSATTRVATPAPSRCGGRSTTASGFPGTSRHGGSRPFLDAWTEYPPLRRTLEER